MPTRRIAIALAALLIALIAPTHPAAAATNSVTLSRSPVSGAANTNISVSGSCDAPTGRVDLAFPVTSDALLPPNDSESFTPDGAHHYTATLTSTVSGAGDFPRDMIVRVTCGIAAAELPFAAWDRLTPNAPAIFSAPGDGPCGFAFVAPGDDPTIPCPALVKGFSDSGQLNGTNFFVDGWTYGGTIAVGNVLGDTNLETVVASGPHSEGRFVITDLGGNQLFSAGVYPGFMGGVNVAVGDVTGDGKDDIVTAAGPGGGPHVRVFSLNGQGVFDEIAGFFAYDTNFKGGVSVAIADVTGDGSAEIITGAGPGGGPHVRIFNAQGQSLGGFFAYAPGFSGGVSVAGGDVVSGGKAEIVTGAGPGGGPHVRTFNADGSEAAPGFFAYDQNLGNGVWVAVGDADAATGNEIVTVPGKGVPAHIKTFNAGQAIGGGFYAYASQNSGGRVAVVRAQPVVNLAS